MLGRVKLMRAWGGLCDVTPDYSPIMGASPLQNYWLDAGWGTYGFKAAPIVGVTLAPPTPRRSTTRATAAAA